MAITVKTSTFTASMDGADPHPDCGRLHQPVVFAQLGPALLESGALLARQALGQLPGLVGGFRGELDLAMPGEAPLVVETDPGLVTDDVVNVSERNLCFDLLGSPQPGAAPGAHDEV